jgi:hypothetical protein
VTTADRPGDGGDDQHSSDGSENKPRDLRHEGGQSHPDRGDTHRSRGRDEGPAPGSDDHSRRDESGASAPQNPDGVDVDQEWDQIVHDLYADAAPGFWESTAAPPRDGRVITSIAGEDWESAGGLLADDEGFTPAAPPPLPRVPVAVLVAVAALVAGFVLFAYPSLLGLSVTMGRTLAVLAILGGFIALVSRLRTGEEEDDDSDDGAVV